MVDDADNDLVYSQAFTKCNDELEELENEYAATLGRAKVLEQRAATVRQTLDGLAALLDLPESETAGITETIEKILKENSKFYYMPKNVRTKLQAQNFDLSKYKNPLAVIHTVMKRLAANAKSGVYSYEKDGQTRYIWKEPAEKANFVNLQIARKKVRTGG